MSNRKEKRKSRQAKRNPASHFHKGDCVRGIELDRKNVYSGKVGVVAHEPMGAREGQPYNVAVRFDGVRGGAVEYVDSRILERLPEGEGFAPGTVVTEFATVGYPQHPKAVPTNQAFAVGEKVKLTGYAVKQYARYAENGLPQLWMDEPQEVVERVGVDLLLVKSPAGVLRHLLAGDLQSVPDAPQAAAAPPRLVLLQRAGLKGLVGGREYLLLLEDTPTTTYYQSAAWDAEDQCFDCDREPKFDDCLAVYEFTDSDLCPWGGQPGEDFRCPECAGWGLYEYAGRDNAVDQAPCPGCLGTGVKEVRQVVRATEFLRREVRTLIDRYARNEDVGVAGLTQALRELDVVLAYVGK